MMDISDGLSSELLHICSQSDTGCRVYEERIPIDCQTAVMAEELNMNVTTCALNGGAVSYTHLHPYGFKSLKQANGTLPLSAALLHNISIRQAA